MARDAGDIVSEQSLHCWGFDLSGQTDVPNVVGKLGRVREVSLGNAHVVVVLAGLDKGVYEELKKMNYGGMERVINNLNEIFKEI